MKKIVLIYLLLAVILTACGKHLPVPRSGNGDQPCAVTLSLTFPDRQVVTRALSPQDEDRLEDLNLYLYGNAVDKHYYFAPCTGDMRVELPAGTYEVYALANTGSDLGEKERPNVEAYALNVSSSSDLEAGGRMLMYGRQRITVAGDERLTITLTRPTAKIEVHFGPAAEIASRLTLKSLQLKSVPADCRPFADRPGTSYTDYPAVSLASSSGSYTAYMPENCQGSNPAITSEKEKDSSRAPRYATCLRLSGYFDGKAVAYSVYLGENATTDFNVRGNRHYILRVTITGANPSDFRVSVSELSATPLGASYRMGETAFSTLTLSSQNDPDNYRMLTYALTGKAHVSIDGVVQPPGTAIPFLSGSGTRQARIAIEALQPGAVGVAFTVKDLHGMEVTQSLSTTFTPANPIEVSSTPITDPYAHSLSTFSLTVREAGYSGNFRVRITPQNIPAGAVSFDGQPLDNAVVEKVVAAGTYPMSVSTLIFTGELLIDIEVTDDNGQHVSHQIIQGIAPLPVTVTPRIRTGTISTAPDNGMFRKPSYTDVTYTFSHPLPDGIIIPHDFAYRMEDNHVPPSVLNRQASGAVTVPAGNSDYTARIVYDDEYAPQYHYVNGVETLLRRGYIITGNTTLTVGEIRSPGNSVTFIVNR